MDRWTFSSLVARALRAGLFAADYLRKVGEWNDEAGRDYIYARKDQLKPADLEAVHRAFADVGMPPEMVRAALASYGRPGRPVLNKTRVAGPLAEMAAWAALPEDSPGARRLKVQRAFNWRSIVAESYAGELARLGPGCSQEAERNVAETFGVSPDVIHKVKAKADLGGLVPDPHALDPWRSYIKTGRD